MPVDPFLMGIVTTISVCLLVLFVYTSYRFKKHLKDFKSFYQNYNKDMDYFNRQMDSRFEAASIRAQTNRDLAEGRIMEVRRILENKIQELEKSIDEINKSSDKLYS